VTSKKNLLLVSLTLALGVTVGLTGLLGSAGPQPSVRAAAGDVYCVTPGGGSYAACTRVFTHVQAAVDAATGGEEIRVAAGIFTGVRNVPSLNSDAFTATQVLVITKSVTIRGGYTIENWSAPDPAANPTTLDAQGQGRVLVISGTIAPTVEGLRITGGDATGLGGDLWGRDGGGGVYVWEAAPTISGCVVTNNTASRSEWASGGGLFLRYGAAILSRNTVVSNTASTGGQGCGGGLSLRGGNPILSGNTVVSNTASTASVGHGGGMCVRFGQATLSGNAVASNTASTADWGYGGGLFVRRGTAALSGNTVRGNVASTASGGSGGGLYLEISDATLSGNTIVGNAVSAAYRGDGGGLQFYRGDATLINNVVADNQANTQGSELWFGGTLEDPTSAHLLHNTITDNGSTPLTTGGSTTLTAGGPSGLTAVEGSGQGVFVDEYTALAFTNTIIAGYSGVGITVTAGSTATLEATLWHNNASDTGGAGAISTGTVNVFGDPGFVDPSAWDYHLTARSVAIDQGVDAGVTYDLDNSARPIGRPDLGAYEWGTRVTLPLVLRRIEGLVLGRPGP
jgi:hypothetical protein